MEFVIHAPTSETALYALQAAALHCALIMNSHKLELVFLVKQEMLLNVLLVFHLLIALFYALLLRSLI